MTEGLSLAGMAEMPVAIVMAQRTGPSTGLPTYTAQGDLHFVLNAGQGEFPRFVVAPGDAEDAYYWSSVALNMAWKYPDSSVHPIRQDRQRRPVQLRPECCRGGRRQWHPCSGMGRGRTTATAPGDTGVSPLAYPPQKGQVIKSDSYTHDVARHNHRGPANNQEDERQTSAQGSIPGQRSGGIRDCEGLWR